MAKQRYKVTTQRKILNNALVNPNKCNPLLKVWIDTKSPSNLLEDAILSLRTGEPEAALREISVALAIRAEDGNL
jgi:hypothetical protein